MLINEHRKALHRTAMQSIEHGLISGTSLNINPNDFDAPLRENRATFVTLKINSQLRGCIGILDPLRPLVGDVAHNAYAAAFQDSRFSPLQNNELENLDIHISILGQREEMTFDSEKNLLEQIRAGTDGIILEEGSSRATFLPSVWESLQDKSEFINHLKLKAGLGKNYWSDAIRVQRYMVEEF